MPTVPIPFTDAQAARIKAAREVVTETSMTNAQALAEYRQWVWSMTRNMVRGIEQGAVERAARDALADLGDMT